jgi:hypothetical protein
MEKLPNYPTDLNYHQDIRPIGETNWGTNIERLANKPYPVSVTEAFPSEDTERAAVEPVAASDRLMTDDYARITECLRGKHSSSLSANRLKEAAANRPTDPDGFPQDERNGLTRLTEAFTFNTFGKGIRLYNFGNTPMSDEALAATANAIRTMEQNTGGALSEELSVIAVLPNGHPVQLFQTGIGETSSGGGSAFTTKGLITVGEKALDILDTQPANPIERHPEPTTKRGRIAQKWKNLVQTDRKRQLEKNQDQAILRSEIARHQKSYEQVLVHEFAHILEGRDSKIAQALKWDVGKETEPSNYAKTNAQEHLAELVTGRFTGGLHDQAVGPKHRQLYQRFLGNVNAGQNGPAFVSVQELDISRLAGSRQVAA